MPIRPLIEHYSLDDYRRWEGDWELIQGMPLAIRTLDAS
ncbi:hypothetical protein BDD21_4197 [Thiocapsa rosea]|uniref:Uma2 family endonuclease n=1 Tax=Thiocapsa rosea TaxID=69360 RepID=A0A495VE01_9GAMM|nr:hypothetical protein BDD21_4197 [Thiocapsa rosea]